MGLGDGGGAGDPDANGQNPQVLLGKLLRLDVEGATAPYGIPPTNPFVGDPGAREEIWATGLRNPWRFTFDRATGDLFIADVGQNQWEEVNFQPAASLGGENYGWRILEGPACFNPAVACTPPPGYVAPVAVYDHAAGDCSITGGHVYRGPENPLLEQGTYVYGDFCSGRVWGLQRVGAGWENSLLADTSLQISSFGEDEAGRLYLADLVGGVVYRLDVQ